MVEFLYSLFVWPFQVCIETSYVLFMRTLGNQTGMSILLSSVLLNIVLMPFSSAKGIQAKDTGESLSGNNPEFTRKLNKLFYLVKPYLFILFYALLFLATQVFFNNIHFKYSSFGIIEDLTKPDTLFGIHYIPLLMLAAALIAVIGVPLIFRKTVNTRSILFAALFGVFFVILYNASSALCLFWLGTACFLCLRNIMDSLKNPARWYKGIILAACAGFLLILFRKFNTFRLTNILGLFFITAMVILITAFSGSIKRFLEGPVFYSLEKYALSFFRYSCIILFLLTGFVIPLLLFASSPTEFASPWRMVGRTAVQSASVFFICAFFYWDISPKIIRRLLAALLPFAAILAVVSCFVFPGDYGIITTGFIFEGWERADRLMDLARSVIAVVLPAAIIFCLFKFRKFQWLNSIFIVLVVSLVLISGINGFTIIKEINLVKDRMTVENKTKAQVFRFSFTEKNIFVLFIDRAGGYAMNTALKLDPGLAHSLDGFTWYPNTVSFGNNTLFGFPAMIGGYEYRPLQQNERTDISLKDKVNEAARVLPGIFADAGYQVMVTDPTYSNLSWVPDPSIYDGMKNVQARNINGIFRERYDKTQVSEKRSFASVFDYDVTIKFSLFRILPPVLRSLVYNSGNWLKSVGSSSYNEVLKHYPNLLYLEDLCSIESSGKYFNIMMNETTHSEGAHNRNLELVSDPILYTDEEIGEFGSIRNAEYMYTFSASVSAVGKWCEWLKKEGIYDNTKIIVISDHGRPFNGRMLSSDIAEERNPLLLIKDFNRRGDLAVSEEFMTNADLPVLATGILGATINPYTGKPIDSSPKDGRILICDGSWLYRDHKKESLIIDNIWELKNRNIFDPENWVKVEN